MIYFHRTYEELTRLITAAVCGQKVLVIAPTGHRLNILQSGVKHICKRFRSIKETTHDKVTFFSGGEIKFIVPKPDDHHGYRPTMKWVDECAETKKVAEAMEFAQEPAGL